MPLDCFEIGSRSALPPRSRPPGQGFLLDRMYRSEAAGQGWRPDPASACSPLDRSRERMLCSCWPLLFGIGNNLSCRLIYRLIPYLIYVLCDQAQRLYLISRWRYIFADLSFASCLLFQGPTFIMIVHSYRERFICSIAKSN